MSGVVITYKITELFGQSVDPTLITLPVPNVSPGAPAPNRASFDTGFPAICFQPVTSGGKPPSGKDINGVYYMLSQYALAQQAGQAIVPYDAATQTAIGGYAKGALLAKADGTGFWQSDVAANMTDPDTGGAGWISFTPQGAGDVVAVPANGANNNFAPSGYDATTAFLDLNPSGVCNITGLAAGYDGQIVTLTNVSANNVTINALNAGSVAANRFRLPFDTVLSQNSSITVRYSTALSLWVLVS